MVLPFDFVEMNEDQPNEYMQRLFFQSFLLQGSHHHPCTLAGIRRQAEEWESFVVRSGGMLQVCPDWRLFTQGNHR